jgi:ATP-dependent helicase/nuclease subunit B
MSAAPSFLDRTGPRWFTIPSGEDFSAALARGILDASAQGAGPFALHDTLVLVPTRRAVRSLAEAFLAELGEQKALLLPQILPIGDVDADEPPFLSGRLPLGVAAEISSSKRLFALAEIIQYRAEASGAPVSLSGALTEAAALAGLIESAAHEKVRDFSPASEAFASFLQNQPEHIQRAARFLEILQD